MTTARLFVPQKRFQYLCLTSWWKRGVRRKSRRGNIASAEGNLEIIDGVPVPSLSHRSRETFAISSPATAETSLRSVLITTGEMGVVPPSSLSGIDNLVEIFQPDKTVRRNSLNNLGLPRTISPLSLHQLERDYSESRLRLLR